MPVVDVSASSRWLSWIHHRSPPRHSREAGIQDGRGRVLGRIRPRADGPPGAIIAPPSVIPAKAGIHFGRRLQARKKIAAAAIFRLTNGGDCVTLPAIDRRDRSPATARRRGFSSPWPENHMRRSHAIEGRPDAIQDCIRGGDGRRTGWPASRAGRRFRAVNPSWFSSAFPLLSAGFRPAFFLFFLRKVLKYNEIAFFSRTERSSTLARRLDVPQSKIVLCRKGGAPATARGPSSDRGRRSAERPAWRRRRDGA